MPKTFAELAEKASTQLASDGQVDLLLYADILASGFLLDDVVAAAEQLNTFAIPE